MSYSEHWRNLGYVKWYDPYAAYEDPTSEMYKEALTNENKLFQSIKPDQSFIQKDLADALPKLPTAAQETMLIRGYVIYIQHSFGHRHNVWIYKATKLVRMFSDCESFGAHNDLDYYFTINDVGNGDQTFELNVYRYDIHIPVYTISNVGPNAAFYSDYLYYLSTENLLRSNALYRVNVANGRQKYKVYEEHDKRYNLVLINPPRQKDIFLRTENALSQRLSIIKGNRLQWFGPPLERDGSGQTVLPIAENIYATNPALVYNGRKYPYPQKSFIVDAVPVNTASIAVATIKKGITNVYLFCLLTHKYKAIYISKDLNNIGFHKYSSIPSFTALSYYTSNKLYEIKENSVVLLGSLPEPLTIITHKSGTATSADGTHIPYTYVSLFKQPKKLIVAAYGAYGISSSRSYPIRWLPWLRRGYAFVEACVRGGRENGDAWYDAARTALRKHKTFEDAAAVIKTVQNRFNFKKENTLIYGRSAGGWTAAYVGLMYADRVAAVYAEVAYLDVLRTTTNPTLPLTQLEYDEFGNPAARPEEYAALQKLSPVDIVPAAPRDPPLFLLRTALHDSQVYPYESLKFAAKLRGYGWPVCTGIDDDGGHFTKTQNMYEIFAADFTILDAALKSRRTQSHTLRQARTRLRSHRSNGITRRRTSSLKHNTRHSVSPVAE